MSYSLLSIGLTSLEHFEIFFNTNWSHTFSTTTRNCVNQWSKHKWYLFLLAKIFQCSYNFSKHYFDCYSNVYKTVFIDIKAKFFFKHLWYGYWRNTIFLKRKCIKSYKAICYVYSFQMCWRVHDSALFSKIALPFSFWQISENSCGWLLRTWKWLVPCEIH